jgi:hypothetical protein
MPPRTAGFGNRDRFELNGKIGLHRAAGFIVLRECRQWQHNVALSGSIPLKTGLMADGFNKLAACHWPIRTSPRQEGECTWLVIAIMTTSGLARLYAQLLTMTAGRCL